jgi:lysine 2,3-aminomutase
VQKSLNWTSELQLAFKHASELYSFLEWEMPEELKEVTAKYSLFIPRGLAQRIKELGPKSPLAREFLPHTFETGQEFNRNGFLDPIGDKEFLKAPQLIHRYKTRALFTPTSICPVHCRYCFRKNELSAADDLFVRDFEKTLVYLKSHKEISEIIFTGGDPLTLSSEKLENYLTHFNQIPSIKDIRFHSRFPVILPERLDQSLLDVFKNSLKNFRTTTVVIHINHKTEISDLARKKISELVQTGAQVLAQTVLLKDVNDDKKSLVELFDELLNLKIRPYYLHHPDRVKGGMHFYLPLERGRELYAEIRKELPGWATPKYVIDIPAGHGKTSAFNPENLKYSGKLLSREGELINLPEVSF